MSDIKNGTILLVHVIKSKRLIVTKGINIAEGSMWGHAETIIEKDGIPQCYGDSSLQGATWTTLADYQESERQGECILCYKNYKDKDTNLYKKEYLKVAEETKAIPYNIWTILKMIPRQILQQLGIDRTFKTNPLKRGFVCSVRVCYIANRVLGVFPMWQWYSPDDIHKDIEFTYFVQV